MIKKDLKKVGKTKFRYLSVTKDSSITQEKMLKNGENGRRIF